MSRVVKSDAPSLSAFRAEMQSTYTENSVEGTLRRYSVHSAHKKDAI